MLYLMFFNGPNPFVVYKLKDEEGATEEMEGRWSRALVFSIKLGWLLGPVSMLRYGRIKR
jgi:hypothetical protein